MTAIPLGPFTRNAVFAPVQGTATPAPGTVINGRRNAMFTPVSVAPPTPIPRRKTAVVTIRM